MRTTINLIATSRLFVMILLCIVCIYGLSSCVGIVMKGLRKKIDLRYDPPAPGMYADSDFKGIRDLIETSTGEVNIVLTHGLGETNELHFDFMVEWMAYDLGLKLKSPDQKSKTEIALKQAATDDPKSRTLGFGAPKLFKWEFVRKVNQNDKPVNFYFIYWTPITKSIKDFILKYDSTGYRTGLSRFSKKQFLIDIFGDLALYLNTTCQIQLHQAFLQALEEISGEIVFVGGGFGAQVMFDALVWELDKRKTGSLKGVPIKDKIDSLNDKHRAINAAQYISQEPDYTLTSTYQITKVFLVTNQLPFTSLLNLVPEDSARAEILNKKIYSSITKFCEYKNGLDNKYTLELNSFYDPNDPLGYRLPPSQNNLLRVNNICIKTSGYWNIDPKLTSDLILPQIKNSKAAGLFLGVIDQKSRRQDILLNLKGPASFSRNDYRIIGALTAGSRYDLICVGSQIEKPEPRNVNAYKRTILAGFKIKTASRVVAKLQRKIEVKGSILPFAIPSQFRDSVKSKAGRDTVLYSKSFDGMKRSVAANDLTQLITVHGVKNQPPDHFDQLTGMIATSLGFYSQPVGFRVLCARGDSCKSAGPLTQIYRPGTVKVSEFVGTYGKRLIVYSVYLSSITKPAKEWLDSISIYQESTITSKMVKREMITDGFSDIELNFSHFKGKADSTLRTAFDAMETDYRRMAKPCALPNTYYMSGSLGTKILLDFINSCRSPQANVTLRKEIDTVLSRTKTWFMLTNQLVLTGLKDASFNGRLGTEKDNAIGYTEYYKAVLGSVEQIINDKKSPFEIVAFNDPNDLLSFVVPDSVMGVGNLNDKIYNNYVNLAEGLNLDMDALIRYASKADRILQQTFREAYKHQLDSVNTYNKFLCNQKDKMLNMKSNAFMDYKDILMNTKNRLTPLVNIVQPNLKNLNSDICAELAKDSIAREASLRSHLKIKKEWFVSDFYVPDSTRQEYLKNYQTIRKRYGKQSVIRRSNFMKLYKPGLIMPFLRNVSSYMHYQDFVVNFGQAHVGSKSSNLIATMMAQGFDALPKTNVNQNLYNVTHVSK